MCKIIILIIHTYKGWRLSQVQQNYDIPIHDIKPLVDIPEYSLYLAIGIATIIVFLLISLLYFIYKWFKNRNKFNLRKEHYKSLHELDLNDTKNAAYQISSYGYIFKDDSPRHTEMYDNLTQRLENYKYRKSVKAFDEEVKGYIELYRGMIDV